MKTIKRKKKIKEVKKDLVIKCKGNLELFYGRSVIEDKYWFVTGNGMSEKDLIL